MEYKSKTLKKTSASLKSFEIEFLYDKENKSLIFKEIF